MGSWEWRSGMARGDRDVPAAPACFANGHGTVAELAWSSRSCSRARPELAPAPWGPPRVNRRGPAGLRRGIALGSLSGHRAHEVVAPDRRDPGDRRRPQVEAVSAHVHPDWPLNPDRRSGSRRRCLLLQHLPVPWANLVGPQPGGRGAMPDVSGRHLPDAGVPETSTRPRLTLTATSSSERSRTEKISLPPSPGTAWSAP